MRVCASNWCRVNNASNTVNQIGTISWLDYIVSSADFHHCIQTVSIDYDISDVHNSPVLMDMSRGDIPETSVSNHVSYRRLSWDKLKSDG